MMKKKLTADNMKKEFETDELTHICIDALHHTLGRRLTRATESDKYQSLAIAIRSMLMDKWLETENRYRAKDVKRVFYLSLEFLLGRAMHSAISNIQVEEESRRAVQNLGALLEDVYELEYAPALGNGGLGRLAACFLDSMATMGIAGYGYGIRYEYGMFNQIIQNGWQMEKPDNWLYQGNPWEIRRGHRTTRVKFYGRSRPFVDNQGRYRVEWVDTEDVLAVPYAQFVPGYANNTVNLLTLWSARATDEFNLDYFNHGDYIKAVTNKEQSETISKVLYPNDNMFVGRELRLKQQYFLVSASLQEIVKYYLDDHPNFDSFCDKTAIQLNDTHPSLAVPELMRILVDEHLITWDKAWDITTKTLAYTNHTLLPEALEKWDVELFGKLLPRHLEIIYEINARFLKQVASFYKNDPAKLRDLSIIEEDGGKRVRMANLAIVGSHSVNGVAELHTKLLKERMFPDFNRMWPEKFHNITNGVTQRRWLHQSNPRLSELITSYIGDGWITDLEKIKGLLRYVDDKSFQNSWAAVKEANKKEFAAYIKHKFGFDADPASIFDFQVKRMHEYKRQLLNVLGVVARYLRIKEGGRRKNHVPRTVFLGGKAAPGYYMAKLVIKLVNDVAAVINEDPDTSHLLKIFFLPNYRVTMAERIFPASDLSQQISTAGKEASGTGNMKFALNGALTVGTLDGANIEIKDAVGDDNIFIFGLKTEEVAHLRSQNYNPWDYYMSNPELKRVVDLIGSGYFSPDDETRFKPIVDSLLYRRDHYLHMANFASYMQCQERIDKCYLNQKEWTRKAITNVANMSFFSSDRSIMEYAHNIWGIK